MATASQALKIYELLNKHFKNEEDAKSLVQEIEQVIDGKFQNEKDRLATREDLVREISEAKIDIIKWVVGMAIAVVGLVVAFIKLL